jgi:hypothetical protein
MCWGAGHDAATGPGRGGFRGIVCRKNPFAPPSAVGCFSPGYLCRQQALGQREEIYRGNLWPNVRLSLQPLLADSDAWVTTLLDFYGLPDDFPGVPELPSLPGSALDAVRHVEGALSVTLGSPARFVPFIAPDYRCLLPVLTPPAPANSHRKRHKVIPHSMLVQLPRDRVPRAGRRQMPQPLLPYPPPVD